MRNIQPKYMSEEPLRGELNGMRHELNGLKEWLKSIDVKLGELRDRVLTTPVCPNPGACIRIGEAVTDHEKRLRQLEKEIEQSKGARAVARLLWSALGGSVGAGLVWIIKNW